MGDSAPRRQPLNVQGTGETRKETNDEPEQESQAEPDASPAADPTKKQGPKSKFHGTPEARK